MAKQPAPAPLTLSTPDVSPELAFVRAAPVAAPIAMPPEPAPAPRRSREKKEIPNMRRSEPIVLDTPDRGHVLQASGRIVRRLVVNVPPDIGAAIAARSEETGASLSRVATDLLREALGL